MTALRFPCMDMERRIRLHCEKRSHKRLNTGEFEKRTNHQAPDRLHPSPEPPTPRHVQPTSRAVSHVTRGLQCRRAAQRGCALAPASAHRRHPPSTAWSTRERNPCRVTTTKASPCAAHEPRRGARDARAPMPPTSAARLRSAAHAGSSPLETHHRDELQSVRRHDDQSLAMCGPRAAPCRT